MEFYWDILNSNFSQKVLPISAIICRLNNILINLPPYDMWLLSNLYFSVNDPILNALLNRFSLNLCICIALCTYLLCLLAHLYRHYLLFAISLYFILSPIFQFLEYSKNVRNWHTGNVVQQLGKKLKSANIFSKWFFKYMHNVVLLFERIIFKPESN